VKIVDQGIQLTLLGSNQLNTNTDPPKPRSEALPWQVSQVCNPFQKMGYDVDTKITLGRQGNVYLIGKIEE
jgi:hypothetical protein